MTDFKQCPKCSLDFAAQHMTDARVCPNCGYSPDGPASETPKPVNGAGSAANMVQSFWKNIIDIIFAPHRFFSENLVELRSDGGISSALAFAVIVQWIAAFFNFVWSSTLKVMFAQKMHDFFQIASDVMEQKPGAFIQGFDRSGQAGAYIYNLLLGAGQLVLSPFATLAQVLLSALFIHLGVLIFCKETPEAPRRYSTTLKVIAYCSAPMILCILPGVGLFLALLLWFVPALTGLSMVYNSTRGRAMGAVLTPTFLGLVILILFVFIFAVIGFGILRLAV